MGLQDVIVTATDMGGAKRARALADLLDTGIAIIDKQRKRNDDNAKAMGIVGDVRGKIAVIIDDEISTGRTVVEATTTLLAHGASEVLCCVTHAIMCGNAASILAQSGLSKLIVTDTLPLSPEKLIPNLEVISVAPLLGEAIHRIHNGLSVGAMFEDAPVHAGVR